jgi:hypothetical protein
MHSEKFSGWNGRITKTIEAWIGLADCGGSLIITVRPLQSDQKRVSSLSDPILAS